MKRTGFCEKKCILWKELDFKKNLGILWKTTGFCEKGTGLSEKELDVVKRTGLCENE